MRWANRVFNRLLKVLRYTGAMRSMCNRLPTTIRAARQGFSLVELSVVVAIISVVAVLGLETTATFMGRTAYQTTAEKLRDIDTAIVQYRRIYGRLPCPATRTLARGHVCFGKESRGGGANQCQNYTNACYAADKNMHSGQLLYGDVPVRDLGLPISHISDAYGNKLTYIVTTRLTVAGTAANQYSHKDSVDAITVRSGKLAGTCNGTTNCQNRGTAAYFVFSSGADKRGAATMNGTLAAACYAAQPVAKIDGVNCRLGLAPNFTNGGPSFTLTPDIFYDSRYNGGTTPANFFDDVVRWRAKNAM